MAVARQSQDSDSIATVKIETVVGAMKKPFDRVRYGRGSAPMGWIEEHS